MEGAGKRPYVCVCMRALAQVCVCVHVLAYVRVCVPVSVCARVFASVHASDEGSSVCLAKRIQWQSACLATG